MKHYVFLFGSYYPDAGSTSLCTINVIKALQEHGDVNITCVCRNEGNSIVEQRDGLVIHRVETNSWSRKFASVRGIKKLILYFQRIINDVINFYNYPDSNKIYSRKLYRELELINQTHPIDAIVATYMPFQTVSAALMFKDKHNNVPVVGYFLDTMRGKKLPLVSRKRYLKICDKAEHNTFAKLDRIILMKYAEYMFASKIFDDVRHKMVFLSFPSLRIRNIDETHINKYNCCFIGSTYKEIRNPYYALQVFDKVSKKIPDVRFQIIGKSDMSETLMKWAESHPQSFSFQGFISSDRIEAIYDVTDYIVSIGNKSKGVVPGKTFEIFGKLKPIIHFTDEENDSALEYIRQYPNVCIINMKESITDSANQIIDFLQKPYTYTDPIYIEKTYSSATPKAAVEVILSVIR